MKKSIHRPMIFYASLLLIINLFGGCQPKPEEKEELPNILILVADDAGWEDFGCYGNEYIVTPNLDKLAANGKVADNAFLTIAQCSPSRISILSGRFPHATGAEDLHMPLPDTVQLLPAMLKEKKYYTGLLDKSHLGPNGDSQFDFINPSLDAFDQFVDQSGNHPFFMWVGFRDPHRTYRDSIFVDPQSPEQVALLPYWVDDLPTRNDVANYYDEIRRMDQQIGQYLASLEKRNELNNTLVIFISDNGAPFPRAKGTVYDAGIKTPLIIHWPDRVSPNQRTNALISLVDLVPSITQLVGLETPEAAQGSPAIGLLDGHETVSREYIFAERNWHNCDEHIRTIRSQRYKLIKNAYLDVPFGTPADIGNSPSFKSLLAEKNNNNLTKAQQVLFQNPRPEYELYDLESDPYELNNLIGNNSLDSIADQLKNKLEEWIVETNDFPASERRRADNTDRLTGVKFDQTKLPPSL
ncbi:MAG: sulfatase [Cyclobacteriaceae bacterium]